MYWALRIFYRLIFMLLLGHDQSNDSRTPIHTSFGRALRRNLAPFIQQKGARFRIKTLRNDVWIGVREEKGSSIKLL